MPRRLLALAALAVAVASVAACADGASVDPMPSTSATPTAAPDESQQPVVADDAGPSEQAMGEATLVEPGAYEYVVASGDTLGAVAARFGLCVRDISPVTEQGLTLMAGESFVVQRRVDEPLGTVACAMG
ncbi:peptidoglycan DD-metalloendopeptidase family protein [Agrococcus jejuensis]|uniref:LysM domain-containing protein n=1 Tax=Agrococcus jejuensis TaxID=399736 RepID=A0A1G8E027_9MICO|nr:hypothetical protein [Agrococcus jejuensis]SDH63217.1 hypothetical protein SAMN04489720_1839 [Agrococcus jejuensis]